MDIRKSPIPIAQSDADALCAFWGLIFGHSYDDCFPVLIGDEQGWNENTLYLAYEGDRLAGTCLLTQSKSVPEIAGLGEVAVLVTFRGRGIASALCERARDDFFHSGGQALWLATSNPTAFRVYHRLGWRRLANSNVMVCCADGSPEEWLTNYFSDPLRADVHIGSPADRIPMIPLILSPHDSHLLDINLGLFSTRYRLQESCMGLYPKYDDLQRNGGAWFAVREANQVVGLATACPAADGAVMIDGFMHYHYQPEWRTLMQEAIDHARGVGTAACCTVVSPIDDEKLRLYRGLGFREAGSAGTIDLLGNEVTAIRMELH